MDAIDDLLNSIDALLGPGGCPWDQKQTLSSVKHDMLEETAELIDAIQEENGAMIQEELGDLLFLVLFFSRLSEKEKYGTLHQIAKGINEKLIRRHPHVFKERKELSSDQVLEQWHEIKQQEKKERKSPFDKIPKSLPALSQAKEYLKIAKKHQLQIPHPSIEDSESELGKQIFEMVEKASSLGLDPELALRRWISLMRAESA